MAEKRRVLIYGRSLNLAGVTACLSQDNNLTILFMDPRESNAECCIERFNPETIIYDLADPPDSLDLGLLQKQPGIMLVGVDPSCDEVLVLSGRRSRVVSAGELAHLITSHASRPVIKKN